jgi:hypothetical protein
LTAGRRRARCRCAQRRRDRPDGPHAFGDHAGSGVEPEQRRPDRLTFGIDEPSAIALSGQCDGGDRLALPLGFEHRDQAGQHREEIQASMRHVLLDEAWPRLGIVVALLVDGMNLPRHVEGDRFHH